MKRALLVVAAALVPLIAAAQWEINPDDYKIDKKDLRRARSILNGPERTLEFPNPSEGAQWYPEAGLGLFMHWGIHSMLGVQPSWNMIKNYEWSGEYHSRQEYYDEANRFDPKDYNPDRYLKAAKDAGFTYAVLTARHHDGYALWPSKYGIGTRQYMHGRDLLKDYVDACRANGLKVGFYYSPRDWHYPGDRPDSEWDTETWGRRGPVKDSVANRREFEAFFAYVIAQLGELLTNYGKIDLLWLDGMGWYGIAPEDLCTEKVYAWIRSLQPDIVINDRWANIVDPDNPAGTSMRIGDFTTPFECTTPTYIPSEWWEHCHIWNGKGGGWGYNKMGLFRPLSWFFEEFVASRSLGGNFLINVGPSGSGDMHPNYYTEVAKVGKWMESGRESVLDGAGPTPGVELSNVPLTTRGDDIWYAHLLGKFKGQVSVRTGRRPVSAVLLQTGEEVPFIYRDGFVNFRLRDAQRGGVDDVVRLSF